MGDAGAGICRGCDFDCGAREGGRWGHARTASLGGGRFALVSYGGRCAVLGVRVSARRWALGCVGLSFAPAGRLVEGVSWLTWNAAGTEALPAVRSDGWRGLFRSTPSLS